MKIRTFILDDYRDVIRLWKKAGITISRSDSLEAIKHKCERDPELFIVAEQKGQLISAVMGSYDGRRGWVHHLAVDPDWRGKEIGTKMMQELERRLRDIGCEKVNLLIKMDNLRVQAFYEKLGFERDELVFMEKWLM